MDSIKWKSHGINYEEGLKRFLGQEDLYHEILKVFIQENTMHDLEVAMKEEDYESAYRAAHTLKGEAGNLSLDWLYHSTCEFVEALKRKDIESAVKVYPKLVKYYTLVYNTIKKLMDKEPSV